MCFIGCIVKFFPYNFNCIELNIQNNITQYFIIYLKFGHTAVGVIVCHVGSGRSVNITVFIDKKK